MLSSKKGKEERNDKVIAEHQAGPWPQVCGDVMEICARRLEELHTVNIIKGKGSCR